MIYPHPKRGFTGYDPGRLDHVAACRVVKAKRAWLILWGEEDFMVYRGVKEAGAKQYLVRVHAAAAEMQAERAADHAARLARITGYLAARRARAGGKQLEMF